MPTLKAILSWALVGAVAGCAAEADDGVGSSESSIEVDGNGAWRCRTWQGTPCTATDLQDASKRHLVVASAGFSEAERAAFFEEADRVREALVGEGAGNAWSRQKKDQLLFFDWFSGGGALGSDAVALGARVAPNPLRGFSLAVDPAKVTGFADGELRAKIPLLRPMALAVVFNTMQEGVTATAIMPGLLRRTYGVGTMTREHLRSRAAYITSHELAHAGLNFADEYTEEGFEQISIKQIDVVTPLAFVDGSWGGLSQALGTAIGAYSWRMSEILGHNGYHNVTTERRPMTVETAGFSSETYGLEGGFFFGRGTFRAGGKNLMNDSDDAQAPDDGFAFDHSRPQQQVVDSLFGAGPLRPNDFIRAAGPHKDLPTLGGTTAMIFDGHKTSLVQPTIAYDVEIGWTERTTGMCETSWIPVPCFVEQWKTAQKRISADKRTVDLKGNAGYGGLRLIHKIACKLGIKPEIAGVDVCAQDFDAVAGGFLSPAILPVPYQTFEIPRVGGLLGTVGKPKWRFRTDNGKHLSAWSGWSELGD